MAQNKSGLTAKLTKNNFPEIKGALRQKVLAEVNRSVYGAATLAKQLCPVSKDDKNKQNHVHMRDTIVVETYRRGELLRIHVGAGYAYWVNHGHHTINGEWVPPVPFLTMAVDSMRQDLSNKLRKLV